MLTTDLVKKLQNLPYVERVELTQWALIVVGIEGREIASVFVKEPFSLSTTYQAFDQLRSAYQEELLNLLVEYSMTPVDQRSMTIRDDEKAILKGFKGYEWISRNENGSLVVSKSKPVRYYPEGKWISPSAGYIHFFNHLFNFIQWADQEPYNIPKLLEGWD